MVDILEILHSILQDGLTWTTILTIYLAWHKYKEGEKKRESYRRMERKIDLIMEREGITWNGQLNEYQKAQTSLKRWFQWYWVVFFPVAFLYRRRLKKMQISKTWIIGLLGYIAYFIKVFTGYTVPDEMINMISELVLLIIPLVAMFMNMRKPKEEKDNEHTESYGGHGPSV